MSDYVLTKSRNALWDAIDRWPALESEWARKYKFDDDKSPEVNPQENELPAIGIYPDLGSSTLVQNKAHEHRYNLLIFTFSKTWDLAKPDKYWQEIIKAAWQSDGGTGTPYVKKVTGFYPFTDFTVEQDRIRLKHAGKVTMTTIRLGLQVRFNPQS